MQIPNPEFEFHSNRDKLIHSITNISKVIEDLSLRCSLSFELKCPPQQDIKSAKIFKILDLKKNNLPRIYDSCTSSKNIVLSILTDADEYLKKLKLRVLDNSSKVLITGDLNSGKSTLINAILQQNILPTDQQPCTQLFCEVIPTDHVKLAPKIKAYKNIPPNFEAESEEISHEKMQYELQNEDSLYKWFQIFIRTPSGMNCEQEMTVSLIDSPGLNTDLFKTTSLFDQQQDIDVIVFVINASFHLTLSGKEFLDQAAKEKEMIFFVVNKFDEIENQKKCKDIITKQIREILPETFEDAKNLIHFVSSKQYLTKSVDYDDILSIEINVHQEHDSSKSNNILKAFNDFNNMKKSLLNFIYLKRSVSKLAPAKTYCTRLLQDILELSSFNLRQMTSEAHKIETKLENYLEIIEQLNNDEPSLKSDLQHVVSKTSEACFSSVFETACTFSSDIQKLINVHNYAGIWNLRVSVNARYKNVVNYYSNVISVIETKTRDLKQKGLKDIDYVIEIHGLKCDRSSYTLTQEFQLYTSMSVHKPTLLELFHPRDLLRNFGTLNLTTIAGAVFGFQPCINLTWKFARKLRLNPLLASIVIAGGFVALSIYTASTSIENAVLSQLENYFVSRFNKEIWAVDLADRCRQSVALSLSSRSSQIFVTYKRILERNHQELDEISAESERLRFGIDYMNNMNMKIETLLKSCSGINL